MTDVTQYIPQRAPFVMIDEIITAEEHLSKTSFTVRKGHLFVDNGKFTEAGLVENMAQTVAAGAGYRGTENGEKVSVGYIGALKNLKIDKLPSVGDTITTEVSFLHHIANVHVVQGRVYLGEEEIAGCEMKIFIQPS